MPAARPDEAGGSGPERGPLHPEPGLRMGIPPEVICTQSPCLLSPGWTASPGAGNGLRGPGDPEVATSAHSCTLCTWPFPPRPSTFSARTREVGVGSPLGQRSSGRGQFPLLGAGGHEVCWMGCLSREEGPAEGPATSEMGLEGECFPEAHMQGEGSRGTVRGRKPVVGVFLLLEAASCPHLSASLWSPGQAAPPVTSSAQGSVMLKDGAAAAPSGTTHDHPCRRAVGGEDQVRSLRGPCSRAWALPLCTDACLWGPRAGRSRLSVEGLEDEEMQPVCPPFPPVSAVSVLSVPILFVPASPRQAPGKPGRVVNHV